MDTLEMVSLPLSLSYRLLYLTFLHPGNLHLNIIASSYTPTIASLLEPWLYEHVSSLNGSISAEHGIGAMKTHALKYSKDEVSIEWMRKIKEMFDPKGIMNPGKVLLPREGNVMGEGEKEGSGTARAQE